MKSILLKIKNKIYQIILDEIPHYPGDLKEFSFNKEIVLREITSFKWFLSICISIYLALVLSLKPFNQVKNFEKESSSFTRIAMNVNKNNACLYPVKQYRIDAKLGLDQFVSPFRNVLDNYFRDIGINLRLKYQPVEKSGFDNYPKSEIEKCIKDYKSRYNIFVNEELSLSEARSILEKHIWKLSLPETLVINNATKEFDHYKSKKYSIGTVGVNLCGINFNNSSGWKATLAVGECEETTFEILGSVTWKDGEIGPTIRDFKERYPLLNKYWSEISQLSIDETSKIDNSFYRKIKIYIPFLKIELEVSKNFVLIYFILQILILLILFFKAKNLCLKSEELSIRFSYYYSKFSRYISLTFLFFLVCYLNYEILIFIVHAFHESMYWIIYLVIMTVMIPLIYVSFAIQLLNKKYVFFLLPFAVVYLFFL